MRMKDLVRGQIYWDKKFKEKVEFLYAGVTGLAIVCKPNDSGGGMQSAWGIHPKCLTEDFTDALGNTKVVYNPPQLHAGKRKDGSYIWHCNEGTEYWCGDWSHRTPAELLSECRSIICDLIVNHPELIREV